MRIGSFLQILAHFDVLHVFVWALNFSVTCILYFYHFDTDKKHLILPLMLFRSLEVSHMKNIQVDQFHRSMGQKGNFLKINGKCFSSEWACIFDLIKNAVPNAQLRSSIGQIICVTVLMLVLKISLIPKNNAWRRRNKNIVLFIGQK